MSTVLGEEKMRYICGSKYNTAIKRNGQKPFISIGIHLENIKLSKKNAAYSKISIKWDGSFKNTYINTTHF